MYKRLDSDQIIATIDRLSHRIEERFPASGLSAVCKELLELSKQSSVRCKEIERPNILVRVAVGLVLVLVLAVLAGLFTQVNFTNQFFEFSQFLQSFEAFLESFVYLGATGLFFLTIETRIKRSRALDAIHEMRALAHVVDMHQLTKDPEVLVFGAAPTASSPKRNMTARELSRYFDYCSEMLSLISKVAALYIQDFRDSVAMEAVDQVQDLTGGLSQKILQKTALLERVAK